jgi:hypothetical protein
MPARTAASVPVVCDWCERPTTREPRYGRRTRRHKCPHGTWCPRADRLRLHDNHYPMNGVCDACRRGYWVREHARVETRGK